MRGQLEVCPLSCRAMFQPVFRPSRPGVRFQQPPLPTPPPASLAVGLPGMGDGMGLPCSAIAMRWRRFPLFTGDAVCCVHPPQTECARSLSFCHQLDSTFGWTVLTTLARIHFRYPCHPSPHGFRIGACRRCLRLAARARLRGPGRCPRCSAPAVTSDARSSRLLLAEQQVLSGCYGQDSCDSDFQVKPV